MYNLVEAVKARRECITYGPDHANLVEDSADTTVVNIWRDNSALVGRFTRFTDKAKCLCDRCYRAECNY